MTGTVDQKRNVLLVAAVIGAIAYLVIASYSPMIAIACCFAPAGMVAVLRYPMLGFGLLTFLIPLERMQRFTDDTSNFTISLMRLLAIGCLGALVLQRYLQRSTLRLDPLLIIYGIYLLFAIFSSLGTTDPAGAKRAIGTILSNGLFFFLYFNVIQNRRQIYLLLVLWMAANILATVYSAYDWHLGSGRHGGIQTEVDPGAGAQQTEDRWSTVWLDRAEYETLGTGSIRRSMGPTSHAAVYGINLIMTIPFFFVALNVFRRPWQQLALWGLLALVGYNILLTNTRAVMLVAAMAGVLCIMTGLFKVKVPHVLALIAGLLLAVPITPQDIKDRMLDPANYNLENAGAMRVRLEYWDASREILRDKWLTGMGVGNEVEVPKYMQTVTTDKTTVHNTFLQFLLEVGIFGWLVFYGFVGILFFYVRRAMWFYREREQTLEADILRAIQVAMISVLIFGLQVDVFLFPLKGWWLLAMIGLILYRWAAKELHEESGADPASAESAERPRALPKHA